MSNFKKMSTFFCPMAQSWPRVGQKSTKVAQSRLKVGQKLIQRGPDLHALTLSRCTHLTISAVQAILSSFPNLEYLDVSKIFPASATSDLQRILAETPYHKHYLVVSADHIFSIPAYPHRQAKISQDHRKYLFRLNHSAKRVQAAYRNLLIYRIEVAELKARNEFKRMEAIKIQAVVRRRQASIKVNGIRNAKNKVSDIT